MKKKIVSLLCMTLIVLNTLLPACVFGADVQTTLALNGISLKDSNFAFDVTLSGDVASLREAYINVATYDSTGAFLAMGRELVDVDISGAEVLVPADDSIASYCIMLLDGENLLKPLCKSLTGNTSVKEICSVKILSDNIVSIREMYHSQLFDSVGNIIYPSYIDGTIEYYVDPDNSSRTNKLDIVLTAFEYNKQAMSLYSNILNTTLFGLDDIEIILTDNNCDSFYDEIVAKAYISGVVTSVDASNDRLEVFMNGTSLAIRFDFDAVVSGEDTVILIDDAGNELTLNDFAQGDAVAIVSDGTNPKNYIDYIEVIKLSDNVVTGLVESVSISGGYYYITVNGKKYRSAIGRIDVGTEGTFYIGLTGKVISYTPAKDKYGYILEAGISQAADSWEITVLTEADGIVTFSTTEDGNTDVIDYLDYYVNTPSLYDGLPAAFTKWAWDTTTPANNHADYRLVTYKTNDMGEIKCLNPASNTSEISADAEYMADIHRIDSFILEDDAVIFNVDVENAEDAYTADITSLVDGGIYAGFVHKNDDYESVIMIVTDRDVSSSEEGGDEGPSEEVGNTAFSEDDGFAIITNITFSRDEAGDDITMVGYVQNEIEGLIIFNDESVNAGTIDIASSAGVGDVFLFNADASGVVSKYQVIGQISNVINSGGAMKKIGLVSGVTTADANGNAGYFGGKTYLYEGYITNALPIITSKGQIIQIGDVVYGSTIIYVYEAFITADTNRYSYVNVGRITNVATGDFMAEDAYYAEFGENYGISGQTADYYTPVIVRIVDDKVVDIYTSNDRIPYNIQQ